ncbi:trehalase-like domain-containing protein [Arthrobacter sp. ISL-65]|uniref:trehalase-like domain-containing protein n=1 Tax=Arthrobacter sp. ISL-65 TaxID=2819112 RepID=UPI001BE76CC8|nr:trehalase-like domain-containing protein [Arthrobacter sp. ISL-65]MBT2551336.1 hypothetical protein [Arthrobacter sp. ISL-65]
MSGDPIADYALLSDCRSAALVSGAGSVDWLCFPRFDRPSVFGRILGEEAGSWSIRSAGKAASTRRYVGPTMVLKTTYTTPEGAATVTDALVLGDGNRGHDLGTGSPGVLLRQVSCTSGSLDMDVVFAPRPEYGLIRPFLRESAGGLVVRGGADVLALSTPVQFDLSGDGARARLSLRAGESVGFALHHKQSWQDPPPMWDQEEISRRLRDTVEGWTSWSGLHQNYRVAVAGSGRGQRPVPAGVDVFPHWCDRRRAHHVPARGRRRLTQLGLPVYLDP